MKKNLLLVQLSVSVKSSQTYLPPNDSFGYQMNNLFAPKRDGRFIVSILTFQPITTTISTYEQKCTAGNACNNCKVKEGLSAIPPVFHKRLLQKHISGFKSAELRLLLILLPLSCCGGKTRIWSIWCDMHGPHLLTCFPVLLLYPSKSPEQQMGWFSNYDCYKNNEVIQGERGLQ